MSLFVQQGESKDSMLLCRQADIDILPRFDTSFKPQFPIRAHGKNLQDMYAKEVVSYMGLGARESNPASYDSGSSSSNPCGSAVKFGP